MKCLINGCDFESDDLIIFSRHLQFKHHTTSKDYTIKFLCDGKEPRCLKCGKEVRYVSFTFKKYCKEHSYLAESEAGAVGGKIKKTWNKGKTKEDDPRIMEFSERYTGSGNPFFGKTHPRNMIESFKKRNLLSEEEILERLSKREEEFEIFFNFEEYNSRQYQYIKVKCKKCGHEEEKTLSSLERDSRCEKCFPLNVSSKPEQEIENFIRSLGITNIIRNSRKIIAPKELDVYIPDKNIAIEYNGLYWHSEKRINTNSHLEKTELCLGKNISLFHIFSDEWINKQEILKSMISYKLGILNNKIPAKKCILKEITRKEASDFFDKCHIAGRPSNIKISFGLYYNDELVSCLAMKIPYKKKKTYEDSTVLENARFANKLNTVVIGGFSRLLKVIKKWAEDKGYEKIKSFADRRFGEGNVYKTCGFSLIGKTAPNYWYADSDNRYFRTHFRAQNGKTEQEIAIENKVWRVYGCGSNIYEMIL
jgi:hypothetical protein